jgi:hypothetical protein
MNARLQGFLNFLDLLAEGQRRQAESIAGRDWVKFPLTRHQKARLFEARAQSKVTTVN